MSKKEKLEQKLRSKPTDFTWSELETLLKGKGYVLLKGKGSRRKFYNESANSLITLHEPHPEKILKRYVINLVVDSLEELKNEE